MADNEYGQDWTRVSGGDVGTGGAHDYIEGRPPEEQYDPFYYPTIDAGAVGVPDTTDLAEGRPPAPTEPAPGLFYWTLDPDAPENRMRVTPFTKLAYSLLPVFLREADQHANVEEGAWPMLRFLDAPGHIADNVRATIHDMYQGRWTDPATVPDRAVPWLASVLGIPQSQKNVPNAQLRTVLTDMVQNGRAPTGTRAEIANAAKQFLTGNQEALVTPQANVPRALNTEDLALAAAIGYAGRVVNIHIGTLPPVPTTEHRWTGTPNASPSERYETGSLTAVNIIPNPSFETNTAGWSYYLTTLTHDPARAHHGTGSLKITQDPAATADGRAYTSSLPVSQYQTYTWTTHVYTETPTTVALDVFPYDNEFGTGAPVSYYTNEDVTLPAGQWTELTTTRTMPATTITARFVLRLRGVTGTSATVWADSAMAAPLDQTHETYFDGNTADVNSTADDIWVHETNHTVHTWDGNGWTQYTATDITPEAQAAISARDTEKFQRAHTITLVVRADELPGGDLAAFADNLRNVGVIPAGHSLVVAMAAATWDASEAAIAAAGGTWEAFESLTSSWSDVEALGLGDFGGGL